MRTFGLLCGVLILGCLLGLGWRWYDDQKLPHYQGRSLRSWFEEECRTVALSRGMADGARELESKLAIFEMGTNAVPFLMDQALSGREDGTIRKALQRVLSELPVSGVNRWIVSFALVQSQAVWLVGPIKPPAEMVLPRVLPYLQGPNDLQRIHALSLLGSVGDGAEKVLPVLVETLEQTKDPWVRAAAEVSIRSLGSRAASVLDRVIATVDPSAVNQHVIRWIAALGPLATNAVPFLEGIVGAELNGARYEALVALLNIRPDHPGALAAMRETLSVDASSTPRSQAGRDEVLAAWIFAPRRPHADVGALLEPVARVEILAWTANSASYRAVRALERVAPERAAALYRQALDGPGWIHAAIGLLRLNRNDPQATQRLVEAISGDSSEILSVILALREAGSSNAEAIRVLQNRVRSHPAPQETMIQMQVWNAEFVLSRIRYREWMESVGIDEPDW